MNRKHFLQSFLTAGLSAFFAGKAFATDTDKGSFKNFPPYLKPGDTVGITCPAGHVDIAKLAPCINTLQRWGLNVKLGKTVGTQWQRFGGTDDERYKDFQAMLDDESINAIIFGKGGYGAMRIIDRIKLG
jgi:muramoyltetrapeptide carboxypeptidase